MGAKTGKRLLILIAVMILLGGGAYLVRSFQVNRMAGSMASQAEQAEASGDHAKAVDLYRQHLSVVPDDEDVKIKYADALLKLEDTPANQREVSGIYLDILKNRPNLDAVRRKLAVLAVGLQDFETGRAQLAILLQKATDDQKPADRGELEFLMGRCREEQGNSQDAATFYQDAIKHDPSRIETYARLAALFRYKMDKPKEADEVIDAMLKARPDDYHALLASGRYRRPFDLAGSDADFQKALRERPKDPEIYTELAWSAQMRGKYPEARRILEDGLKSCGDTISLYSSLAMLGRTSVDLLDQGIADCRRGIQLFPEQIGLRWSLAELLIMKGDTAGLLEQIEELKRRNASPILTDFLNANHYIMVRKWSQARQLLVRIQGSLDRQPFMKAKVNELMAICHRELGDLESQEAALRRAAAVNPDNLNVRLELIRKLADRGDIGQAIEQYREILKARPQVWNPLARLMIYRALYLPTADQNWGEIESLIADAEKANPTSADPLVMRAEMLQARGKVRDAQAVLEQAIRRFPKSVAAWQTLIGLTGFQLENPDEGFKLLDRAKKELGDQVELRLVQARILTKKESLAKKDVPAKKGDKGSDALAKEIEALSAGADSFSATDRRRLFEGLANEALRGRCPDVAVRLFSQVAKDDPSNLIIRWRLLSLAFQENDEAAIEEQIAAIKKIEDDDHLMGTFGESWYRAWKAEQLDPKTDKDAIAKLRSEARVMLAELESRRPDWAVIPVAYATLEERELQEIERDENLDPKKKGEERTRKRDDLINHYLQAFKGGQRELSIVRRTVELLFDMDRYTEADEILSKLPPASLEIVTGDFKRMSDLASKKQDFEGALEIARKSVAAKPEDFRERIWLAEILSRSGRVADAEVELRQALKLAGGLWEPWVLFIQFLTRTNQIEKAVAALQEAKAALPKDQLALGMAQGQAVLAQAYSARGQGEEARSRNEDAKKWYLTAESEKPDDPRVRRLLVTFFAKTGQFAEAQSRLRAILKDPERQQATEVAWARQNLAVTLLASGDRGQARQALDLFKDREKAVVSADDRRVLIQLLLAQKDQEHTAEAIATSLSLIEKKEASAQDRILLAQLYQQAKDWPKAREQYRDLLKLQPDNKDCLTRYAKELIARVGSGATQDADEARELIKKLKVTEPDYALGLETDLLKTLGKTDQAVDLIKSAAELPDAKLAVLGLLSERIGQLDLAEQLLLRWEGQVKAKSPRATLDIAAFLGRNGRIKEAIDRCEKALADGLDPEDVARTAVAALFNHKNPLPQDQDQEQAARVAGLIEKGMKSKPQSAMLAVALGNLRERQQRYEEAIDFYRKAVELGARDGVPLNNLAWLTALRERQGKTALDLINRAIMLNGPIPDFLDTRGVAYLIAGENRLAFEDLMKAVEADPSPAKLIHLAQACSKLGDKERAKQNLELARTKGLEIKSLHPLEVTDYRRLLAELGSN